MAATRYVAEEREDSLFQFQSPDMDTEPHPFGSGICSATKGKRSRRSRQSLSLIPRSESTALQQEQDQEEEEEDEEEMAARCLMMLLSDGSDRQSHDSPTTTSSSESLAPSTLHPIRRRIKKPKRLDVGDADSPYGLEWDVDFKQEMMMRLYACKSCNRKFSSFQALGGHRASCHHKSKSAFPRLHADEGFKEAVDSSIYGPTVETYKQSLYTEIKKVKVHECPVCHRIFPSGQALGGHKRTHSTPLATSIHTSTSLSTTEQQHLSPPRRSETLDLNMPAEDANDCIQMQHSSPVSVNLGGDLLDSSSWSPYDYRVMSYNSSQPWWTESHQPGVVREDETDSQLGSNSGFVRGRDLESKRAGLPLIATVN